MFGKKIKLNFLLMVFVIGLCSAQEFGLVLSGGGGKGAYEVGVWKALNEYGVAQRITVISGSSVGGLNGALFACENIDTIEHIWKNIVPHKLTMDKSSKEVLISQDGLSDIIDFLHLSTLYKKTTPVVSVSTVRDRFVLLKSIFSSPGDYVHNFVLNDEYDDQERKKILLATSAVPLICDSIKLRDGYYYMDGGSEFMGGDNMPIAPIFEHGKNISTVIVVYLDDSPDRRINKIDYDKKCKIIEIIPTIKISQFLVEGALNFTYERISLLIDQGYEDACRILDMLGYSPVSAYWFEDMETSIN